MFSEYFVNVTVQLALYIGPTPTRFSFNPGITWPVVGNSEGSCDIARSQELLDVIGCPKAVLTWIRGSVGSAFLLDASLMKN